MTKRSQKVLREYGSILTQIRVCADAAAKRAYGASVDDDLSAALEGAFESDMRLMFEWIDDLRCLQDADERGEG